MTSTSKSRPLESQRIALHRKIVLRFADFDGFATEYSANLSMTGMFVRSSAPHPPGTPVRFEFKLADGMDLIQGTGWVVWVRDVAEGKSHPAGMGIEFSEISAESRRLIRWIILHQLPEGEKPFDLASYDDAGQLIDGKPVHEKAAMSNVVAGVAVAIGLSGLALIASLLWPDGAVEPLVATPPVSEPVVEAPPAPDSEPAEEPTPVVPSGAAVERTVLGWADAWSSQDVEAYLGYYGTRFEPAEGVGRAVWEAERRERLRAPEWLRVALTDLQVEVLSHDEARAVFNQAYRSDTFSDIVRKTLWLRLEEGGWKIEREVAGELAG